MIAIAQVSDVHLDGSPERARRARAVMNRLRAARAPLDAILVTGDIADHGRPAEYEEARTIDAVLSDDPGAPALVCLHHYPVPLHTGIADTIRLAGEDRLAAVISRHPQVVAVLCGHAHPAAATTFAGRPLLVGPGVLSTGVTPWDVSATADYEAPPAVAYHIVGDDGRLTTHYRPVDLVAYRPVDLAPGG
jgi:3',5'-cyclic AMP phosphodiesterase CpdA